MIPFAIVAAVVELGLVAMLGQLVLGALRQPRAEEPSRRRMMAGKALVNLPAVMLIVGGISKFTYAQFAVAEMTLLGLTGWKYLLVAMLEILSGVTLLIEPIRAVALLILAAHVGGAICSHLIVGQYSAMLPPAILLTASCLGTFMVHPGALWSVREYAAKQRGGSAAPAGVLREQ